MKENFTIHIVEDEAAVRTAVAFLLMNEGYAVRTYDSGTTFLQTARDVGNACLVTDLRMPDMDGIELLHAMRRARIDMPAIVITGHGDVSNAVAAMKAGAADFIEKPFEDTALIAAIERATTQATPVTKAGPADETMRRRLESLTAREREVLAGILDGKANKAIAFDLKISPRTVEIYRAGLMAKIRAKNLPELLRIMIPLRDSVPWLSRPAR